MMLSEDLRAFSSLGRALWADPGLSERSSVETLAAVSLLDLTTERAVERATAALLERATRDGGAVNAHAFGRAFFRLAAEERLVLATLHAADWSYARVGRILAKSSAEVQELAWRARLTLAASSVHETGKQFLQPGGGTGISCPEVDPRRPWMQRFLDDEVGSRERLFLQNHMMACEGCRNALGRCRDLYYGVDALVPRAGDESGIREMEGAWNQTRKLRFRSETRAADTLRALLAKRDVQWVLGLFGVLIAMKVFWKS